MSDNERREELLGMLEEVKDFVEKVDGVDKYIAVLEGFPVVFKGYGSESEAEAAAALAVDVLSASTSFTKESGLTTGFKEILAVMDENRVIDLAKAREAILFFEGLRQPVEESVSIATSYIEGKRVSCPYCREDLTLKSYKCPKCGRSIPFLSERCPFCGANVRIKRCPKCGNLVASNGKKILEKKIKNNSLIYIESGVGAIIGGLLGYLLYSSNPLVPIITGIIGAVIGGFASSRVIPEEVVYEEIE